MASSPNSRPKGGVAVGKDGDQPVNFESSVLEDGLPATVLRDMEGHVLYPSFVPQGTLSPTSGIISPSTAEQKATLPVGPTETPKKSATEPLSKVMSDEPQKRPSMGQKFMTDAPKRGGRTVSTLPAALQRAGTNFSLLDAALSQPLQAESQDSSSSSSSEDESDDDTYAARNEPKTARKHASQDPFRRFRVGNSDYHTKGKVSRKDGRLNISVKDTSNTGYLAKALGAAAAKVVPTGRDGLSGERKGKDMAPYIAGVNEGVPCPRLNIVIMVIGSRGDAQPFLKIGKVLKEQYGHRVRIATHPAFRDFVEKDSGLEFFSVGGDPAELMAFMVKNPGMIPTLETVKAGDIGRRRAAMAEMFEGFWRSCINATDNEKDVHNIRMMGEKDPFVADAIIANPPSFAHVHCAEALGIPLHLMFTFPYTPTQAFPHPLASIKRTNVDPGYTNFISYPLVEMMVWQGLGDLVNDFRVKTLGLDPVSTLWAPGATYRLHVPFTYLWSPGLVPKPEDWGEEIDISGFVFLELASSFKPPAELEKFLNDGPPPVYIGFGSIVVDDPERFTEMIFEGVKLAGVRALVSKGWGGLGGDNTPDNIYMLDNVPHDWLFPKVSATVIHGGAGTTAISLKCGKPTMIVPFFGDQHFWGPMVANAKAGPEPVPYKSLTAEKLAEGIKYCLSDEAKEAAGVIAKDIELEGDGAENACRAFHRHLELTGPNSMRCSILEDRVAVWRMKDSSLRLAALTADIMVERGYTNWRKLRLIRHKDWNDFEGPGEPLTGAAGSIVTSLGNAFGGVAGVPVRLAKMSNKRRHRKEEKQKRRMAKASTGNKTGAKRSRSGTAESQTNGNSAVKENGSASSDARQALSRVDTTATDAEGNAVEEMALTAAKGVGKSASALARAPVDLAVALSQGFHNAPRLYGDPTVRAPPRVTGMKSGLKAAGSEFGLGIYDGVTGLVRLPVRGAKTDGAKGFAKGVGMGFTGFILKDIGAIFAPVGYTLKGVIKQIERRRQPARWIRRARILQGQRELRTVEGGQAEQKRLGAEVERRWQTMRQLEQALEEQHRETGALSNVIGARGPTAPSEAFESAEKADKALAAVRRGESVEDIMGGSKKRSSLDLRKKSPDSSRAGDSSLARESSVDSARKRLSGQGSEKKKVRASASQPIAEGADEEADDVDVLDDQGLTAKAERPMSPSEKAAEVRKEHVAKVNGATK